MAKLHAIALCAIERPSAAAIRGWHRPVVFRGVSDRDLRDGAWLRSSARALSSLLALARCQLRKRATRNCSYASEESLGMKELLVGEQRVDCLRRRVQPEAKPVRWVWGGDGEGWKTHEDPTVLSLH